MICIVSNEERKDRKLVDKITKLGAAMLTHDLFNYSILAGRTHAIVQDWNNTRRPDARLIHRKDSLRSQLQLHYLYIYSPDATNRPYAALVEPLCNMLDSLTIKSKRSVA